MQHALDLPDTAKLPFADYAYPKSPKGWNKIVLVGEAPGAEEARLGRPFVGRSGQLLDKILERAGIDREQCLIANVFRFQPPANKVDHFFTSRRAATIQNIGVAEKYGKFGSAFCRAEFATEHISESRRRSRNQSSPARHPGSPRSARQSGRQSRRHSSLRQSL